MGEVYRATDTNLKRSGGDQDIPHVRSSADGDRLARFQREAEVLASLNHPNIAAIYGLERSEGQTALVMELVEGPTLADRLVASGAIIQRLPPDEAVRIARQIAEALDVAHERGIVHRDLKPANIGMAHSGMVKLLDFGLAKTAVDPAGARSRGSEEEASAPTMAPTLAGVIFGTVGYMSPEQARGQVVDKRTDIWAFGCVLFEMLTGSAPFGGATVSDRIAGIIGNEPDWRLLPAAVPPRLRRLLHRCLEKDVRRRLRDIGDALYTCLEQPTPWPTPSGSHAPTGVRSSSIVLTDYVGLNEWPAISPDGKMVAFVAVSAGRRQIWIQLLAGGAPLQVTRDEADHSQPRWSPDSSALVYHTSSDSPGRGRDVMGDLRARWSSATDHRGARRRRYQSRRPPRRPGQGP